MNPSESQFSKMGAALGFDKSASAGSDRISKNSVHKTSTNARFSNSPNKIEHLDTTHIMGVYEASGPYKAKASAGSASVTETGDTRKEAYNKASTKKTEKAKSGEFVKEHNEDAARKDEWNRDQEKRGNIPPRKVIDIDSSK